MKANEKTIREKITIEERINELDSNLKGCNLRSQRATIKNAIKDLLKTKKATTVRTYLTKYKNALTPSYPKLIGCFSIPKTEQNKIQKQYAVKLKKQHGKKHRILDSNKIIEIAKELLKDQNPFVVASALCFLTGRRIGEILKTAKFTNSKNSTKVMFFTGQLKTKRKNFKYEIYCLGNSRNECKEALKRLRTLIDTRKMTLSEVNKMFNSSINNYVQRKFGKYLGMGITSHYLRAAYSAICVKRYHKELDLSAKTDKSINDFLSDLLGHEDDVTTVVSYEKYSVLK